MTRYLLDLARHGTRPLWTRLACTRMLHNVFLSCNYWQRCNRLNGQGAERGTSTY